MHANKTIVPNNLESIDSNYDVILKVEELRFVKIKHHFEHID